MKVTVYTVERCYDYEGCSLERVFGTREEADAYAAERTSGSIADWRVELWEVEVPTPTGTVTESEKP